MKKLILLTAILLAMGNSAMAQKRDIKTEDIQGHLMYTVLPKGGIPAVYNPTFIDASAAAEFYFDEEPLLVVTVGETTHAYSTWHLDHHEIVNDEIEGKALAATW